MESSKKIDLFRDFAAGVYLSEAQNPQTHTPPPSMHSVCVYTVQYAYSLREGQGWGEVVES
jgi:hypothetical protein